MKTLKRTSLTIATVMVVVGLTGCGSDDIAAKVNGEVVTVSEIEQEMEVIKAEYPQMFAGVDGEAREIDFRQRILDNRVTNILVTQAAEGEGLSISDEDIDSAIEDLRAGFPSEEDFEESLQQVGMDMESLRQDVREQLLTQAILEMVSEDIEVTAEDIQEYYEDNQGQFQEVAAVRAAHILFAADDKETAERVLQEVRDGADFGSLARQYSIDPASAENKGDLGWPSTPYVSEFQAALEGLVVGEVSDLVETVFGWHIVTVLDAREARTRTLEEAREEIELILQQQRQAEAFQQFIDELRAAAEIEYFVDYAPVS